MSITKPNTSESATLKVLKTKDANKIDSFVNINMIWLERLFLLMVKPSDCSLARDYFFASRKGMKVAINSGLIKPFRVKDHSKHHVLVERSYVLNKAFDIMVYRISFIREYYGLKNGTFLLTDHEMVIIKKCCEMYLNLAHSTKNTIHRLNQLMQAMDDERNKGLVMKEGRIGLSEMRLLGDVYPNKKNPNETSKASRCTPDVKEVEGELFTVNSEDCVDTGEACCEASCDAMWEEAYRLLYRNYRDERYGRQTAEMLFHRSDESYNSALETITKLNKEHDEAIKILDAQIEELKNALRRKDVDYNKDMDAKDKELYGVYEQHKLDADRFIARIGKLIREKEASEDEILKLSKIVEGLHGHILSNTKAMANVNGNLLFRCQGKDQKPFNVSAPSIGVLMTVVKAEHLKTVETVTMHSPVYTFTKAELDFLKKK